MEQKIADIKKRFEEADRNEIDRLIEEYCTDGRNGVKGMIEKYKREKEKHQKELARTEHMKQFEYKYQEYAAICGIDEVGRGPLAGPVVAGAVILPKEKEILYLNDSKQLSARKREELSKVIMEHADAAEIGIVPPSVVDEVNILQATYEAMRIAISRLSIQPDLLLVDAVHIPKVSIKQVGILQGDAKSISIAAASIIAKVARDKIMVAYDEQYPEYHFASNKGYGTSEHIQAIRTHGPCPIHRKSFIRNFIVE